MEANDVLMGVLTILTGFVLLVLPCLVAPPIARWLTRRAEDWLGLAEFRRRGHGPAAERVLEFLGFELYTRRVYGPAEAGGAHVSLAGLAVEPGCGFGPARFGASPRQVEEMFGRSPGYGAWDDGYQVDSLIYDGVRLSFDRHDSRGPLRRSRLWVVEVRRADAVLFNRPLADWGEGELAAELVGRGFRRRVSEPGYAEYDSPYLAAWFEAGWLARVEIAE